MSDTPRRSDPNTLPDLVFFGDDGGDGDDMVGVSGMFESEQEAERQNDE